MHPFPFFCPSMELSVLLTISFLKADKEKAQNLHLCLIYILPFLFICSSTNVILIYMNYYATDMSASLSKQLAFYLPIHSYFLQQFQ